MLSILEPLKRMRLRFYAIGCCCWVPLSRSADLKSFLKENYKLYVGNLNMKQPFIFQTRPHEFRPDLFASLYVSQSLVTRLSPKGRTGSVGLQNLSMFSTDLKI